MFLRKDTKKNTKTSSCKHWQAKQKQKQTSTQIAKHNHNTHEYNQNRIIKLKQQQASTIDPNSTKTHCPRER